ncbi:hypothetical protein AAY473_024888 [Plecturocebus cupreus]
MRVAEPETRGSVPQGSPDGLLCLPSPPRRVAQQQRSPCSYPASSVHANPVSSAPRAARGPSAAPMTDNFKDDLAKTTEMPLEVVLSLRRVKSSFFV